jgi:hypothetical protein
MTLHLETTCTSERRNPPVSGRFTLFSDRKDAPEPAGSARKMRLDHGAVLSIGKQPLFEKSGAKTFFMLGHGRCRRQRP